FIENFRPGRLEEWNLGWETLSEINPELVMVRTTGFGQTGPYKNFPGFGTLAEAMSGFAHTTGQADGPPTLPPFGLADAISAMHSTFATMFALYWRDVNDGTGQYIDSSVLEPIFGALMHSQVVEYSELGIVRERMGNRIPFTAPRNTYKTKDDRWVAISTSAENIAERVLRLVGGEDLVNDPRFQTMRDRVEHVEELDAIMQDWFSEHTREEALEEFREVEAAIAPVYNIEDIFEDPHFNARDAIIEIEDEELGEIALSGVFPKLSATPGRVDHPGPPLGDSTEEILLDRTSHTSSTIADLEERGVINSGD
ncbi:MULTISPECIES: CaiB/BaiF CoA-transferase family protein, partial [Halorussus]|uniref:CaiB/BaiF CoA transferase family protein n=1 Tax=Halorussus TaxID=1070314 RepID=UPI0013B3AE54